jgi:hypothetical protein
LKWVHSFLLDCHSSCRNFEAMYLLENNEIDAVMSPSHCTHVLPTKTLHPR